MVVRLLFQPLEEVSRTLFAKLMPEVSDGQGGNLQREQHAQGLRGARAFFLMLRVVAIAGLTIAAFGSNYCLVLVHILLSSKYVGFGD